MKFFFPDSQDLVDPTFDFESERRSADRMRQRDDQYAHEVFAERPYDGLLVSKGIVDGFGGSGGRYTISQRHRLLREGAPDFFRVNRLPSGPIPIMGDCGAFTYVREEVPPYSAAEVLQFYASCRFDFGISPDHVILEYSPRWDETLPGLGVPERVRYRQEVTLGLASEFLEGHRRSGLSFVPIGAAQGWSPRSYADAVMALQKMGYRYIALGGLVPLKTPDILGILKAISLIRDPSVRLHLLGVTRTEHVEAFARLGATSFDSTSPLRRAFKDETDNYYTMDGSYSAIRVPQVEANPGLLRKIRAGEIRQETARQLELLCLRLLEEFDVGRVGLEDVLDALHRYEQIYDPNGDRTGSNRRVLEARPWEKCACDVCRRLGYHVILFRGAERNRRRGFHNVWVFYRRLKRELGLAAKVGQVTSLPIEVAS